jgi:hypothetical protein
MYRFRPAATFSPVALLLVVALTGAVSYLIWMRWNPCEQQVYQGPSVDEFLSEYASWSSVYQEEDRPNVRHDQTVESRSVGVTAPYVPTKFRCRRLTKNNVGLFVNRVITNVSTVIAMSQNGIESLTTAFRSAATCIVITT